MVHHILLTLHSVHFVEKTINNINFHYCNATNRNLCGYNVKCYLSYKRGHSFLLYKMEKTNTGSMRPNQLTAEYRFLQ